MAGRFYKEEPAKAEEERMSAPFRPYEPDQSFLLPPSPREWLSAEHIAFFVMEGVASLDLKEILGTTMSNRSWTSGGRWWVRA